MIPARSIERLIAYRRLLQRRAEDGKPRIYSHELAELAGITSVLVRRDLMLIGFSGSSARGYDAAALIDKIAEVLESRSLPGIALLGIGSLGRAILKYLAAIHPELPVVAAFDTVPEKVGGYADGCRCHPMSDLERVIRAQRVAVAVLTVPADAAQGVADRLIAAGVSGLLNFTPARLRVPADVYLEDVDVAVSLEKVVYFARAARAGARGGA